MQRKIRRRSVLAGATAALSAPYLMPTGTNRASAQGGARVRHEVHDLVSADGTLDEGLVSYMDAVAETRRSSPLLWHTLTRFHDAFCSTGAGDREVHGNWRFIMWHRAYLVTYERILQEHSDDPVSLPYWNWFKSDALPAAFSLGELDHPGRSLGADSRIPGDPPRPISTTDRSWDRTGEASNYDTTTAFGFSPAASFFGQDFARGARRSGRPEHGGHGGIHNWVGGDMAFLNTAALDPCFYSHHANVDRMLELWKANKAPLGWLANAPTAWKDQVFEFAFNNDRIYRYRAIDMIDTSAIVDLDGVELGFVYDNVPEIGISGLGPGVIAFSQPASTEKMFSQVEMRVTPPSQSFSLGAMEVTGGQGATSAFEITDAARAVTNSFMAVPKDNGVNDLESFTFSRGRPPSARLVLRNVVLPAKNSQINLFINIDDPSSVKTEDSDRYLGTINTVPSREENIVYEELSFEASDAILRAIQSEDRIFVSSFTRYLGEEDVVSIGDVELIIE